MTKEWRTDEAALTLSTQPHCGSRTLIDVTN